LAVHFDCCKEDQEFAGHDVQLEALNGEYVPAGQATHALKPAAAYWPARQAVQLLEPAGAANPFPHGSHV
jgi:hypothetical protein